MADDRTNAPIPGWGPIPEGHEGPYVPGEQETLEQARRAADWVTERRLQRINHALTEPGSEQPHDKKGKQ
jgi:hypothetical protein